MLMCVRVKEVAIGSSFSVKSIYYVLTGVSNRCPGSALRIHNAWVDALLENIHLQRRVGITSVRPHRPAETNNNPPPTPPPAHPNKSTHVIYITASAVIVILELACVITGALPAAEFEGISEAGSSCTNFYTGRVFFFCFFFSFSTTLMSLIVAVQGGFD